MVALWKDPGRGIREIPLETGAQGVLISTSTDRMTRRTPDGRLPVNNASEVFDMCVYQVRAASAGSGLRPTSRSGSQSQCALEGDELTILISWAEAVAEALASAPDRVEAALADAGARAPWRAALGIVEPSSALSHAISWMSQAVRRATAAAGDSPLKALVLAVRDTQPGEPGLERLIRRVLRSALEQRQARKAREA